MSSIDGRSAMLDVSTFWNELVAGSDVRSSSLDSSLADLIVAIHRSDNAPEPDPVFTDRLLAQLSAPVKSVFPNPPFSGASMAPSPRPISDRVPPPRPRWRYAWASLTLLLAVTLALMFFFVPRNDGGESPDAIPAVVPAAESPLPLPGGPQVDALIQLNVDPDLIAPGGRENWSAAAFEQIEIEPGTYFQWMGCPECNNLLLVVMQHGEMRLSVDGPLLLSRQEITGVKQSKANDEHVLQGGDAAIFALNDLADLRAFRNAGSGPAQFLLGWLYPSTYVSGDGTNGLLWTGAWNLGQFPSGDMQFKVEHIVIPHDSEMEYESSPGQLDLFMLAAGKLEAQSAGGEALPSSLTHSWTAPAGVQTTNFPDGRYSLVNNGTEDAELYRLTIVNGAELTPVATPENHTPTAIPT